MGGDGGSYGNCQLDGVYCNIGSPPSPGTATGGSAEGVFLGFNGQQGVKHSYNGIDPNRPQKVYTIKGWAKAVELAKDLMAKE